MATFILVHGNMHGGWCWEEVARRLRSEGHRVFAPSLTGLGDRAHLAHPDVNLSTHIQDITSVLEVEDLTDIVLVGHSYGGFPITGAAHRVPRRVRRLVYLDAYVPRHGESAMQLMAQRDPARAATRVQAVQTLGEGWKIPLEPGWWDPASGSVPYDVTDPKQCAWVLARLRPQPFKTYTEALWANNPEAAGLERVFVRFSAATTGPGEPERSRVRSEDGWRYFEIAAGHDGLITAPGEVTDLLAKLA